MPFIHPTSKDIPRAEKRETTFLAPRSTAERIRSWAQGQSTWFESGSTVFFNCVNWVNLISFCLSFLLCLKMGIRILFIYRIVVKIALSKFLEWGITLSRCSIDSIFH